MTNLGLKTASGHRHIMPLASRSLLASLAVVCSFQSACSGELGPEDAAEASASALRNGEVFDIPAPGTRPLATKPPPKPVSGTYADLVITGTLRFSDDLSIEVDVANVGTAPTPSYYGGMVVGGYTLSDSLYANGSVTPRTLQPGEHGYIRAWPYPAGAFHPCTRYRVKIDTVRQLQKASILNPNVYDNDSGIAKSQCKLTWTSVISEATLYGIYPPRVVGDDCPALICSGDAIDLGADDGSGTSRSVAPEIKGKTIADIVSSFKSGRNINDSVGRCSGCHYEKGASPVHSNFYLPPVGYNQQAFISKDQRVSFYRDYGDITSSGSIAWSDRYGWAYLFVNTPSKPAHLKELFQKWMADGYQ